MSRSWWSCDWVLRKVGVDIHVVPPHDLKPHKKSRHCPCQPTFQDESDNECDVAADYPVVVLHTAYDGRDADDDQ